MDPAGEWAGPLSSGSGREGRVPCWRGPRPGHTVTRRHGVVPRGAYTTPAQRALHGEHTRGRCDSWCPGAWAGHPPRAATGRWGPRAAQLGLGERKRLEAHTVFLSEGCRADCPGVGGSGQQQRASPSGGQTPETSVAGLWSRCRRRRESHPASPWPWRSRRSLGSQRHRSGLWVHLPSPSPVSWAPGSLPSPVGTPVIACGAGSDHPETSPRDP